MCVCVCACARLLVVRSLRPFVSDLYEDEGEDDDVLDEEGRTRLKLKVHIHQLPTVNTHCKELTMCRLRTLYDGATRLMSQVTK